MSESPETVRLILSDEIRPPAPFCPEIASVSLRTPSNDVNDGYSLRITAAFGVDVVDIETESLRISAKLEIFQARVGLDFANCKPSFGSQYSEHVVSAQPSGTISKQTRSTRQRSLDAKATTASSLGLTKGFSAEAGLSGSADASNGSSQSNEENIIHRFFPFTHAAIQHLIIGNFEEKKALKGVLVGDYEGWHVQPEKGKRSGVLATIKVKANWIQLSQIESEIKDTGPNPSPAISAYFNDFKMNSKLARKDLFKELLRNLVHLKLQSPNEPTYATLDCSVLCIAPEKEQSFSKTSETRQRNLQLSDHIFEAFINAETDDAARKIAENPQNFLTPVTLYEFPLCTPYELFSRLGLTVPLKFKGRFWLQQPIIYASQREVDRDIEFMKLPIQWTVNGPIFSEKKGTDNLVEVAKQASRIPIIASAIQDIGLIKMEGIKPKGVFSRIFARPTTVEVVLRRKLDDFYTRVFTNRLPSSQINRKISSAVMWVEFVKDVLRETR